MSLSYRCLVCCRLLLYGYLLWRLDAYRIATRVLFRELSRGAAVVNSRGIVLSFSKPSVYLSRVALCL